MKLYEYVVCIIRKGLASYFCPVIARVSAPALTTFYKYLSISHFCLIYAIKPFVCSCNLPTSFLVTLSFCHLVMWPLLVLSPVTWPFQDGCLHGRDRMAAAYFRNLILSFWFLVFSQKGYSFYLSCSMCLFLLNDFDWNKDLCYFNERQIALIHKYPPRVPVWLEAPASDPAGWLYLWLKNKLHQ